MSTYENEAPTGDVSDNSYVSRQGHKGEPLNVVSDQERIEDPVDARTADSDEQLSMFHTPWHFIIPLGSGRRPGHAHTDPFGTTVTHDLSARDDNVAIDRGNILNERTRGAGKPSGTYAEPGDEEGLPADDGTSSADVKVPE